jgi:hypothetical protein
MSKYPYFASLIVSTHLSFAFYVKRIKSCPERTQPSSESIAHPCADSFLSLKVKIKQLGDMELIKGNECELNKSDDEESLT